MPFWNSCSNSIASWLERFTRILPPRALGLPKLLPLIILSQDADKLEQSIREVVLSKKLSHPNVVQTYAWTVLTGQEAAGAVRDLTPFPPLSAFS